MIKLALVDDDSRLLESLKTHLEALSEIQSVICRTSGSAFAKELSSTPADQLPDVIIMDVSMDTPDEGIKATYMIKRRHPDIHVIMFTISDNDELIFDAFKAGAMGYLLKNETPDSILKAIQEVVAGNAQMSPGIARKTINYFRSGEVPKREVIQDKQIVSPREIEVLDLVAKGYTYNQIAEMLNISTATVKTHMSNVFEKLHVKNKIEALLKTESLRERS
jgi:DNA-binding NarL/FixJ family response regulator